MRDALSLLDQAIAFGGGRVGLGDVRDMLGAIDQRHVFKLLAALAEGDAAGTLTAVTELEQAAPDYAGILAELISLLQRVAVIQAVPEAFHEGDSDPDELRRLASALTAEDVQLFYQIALIGRRDLHLSPDPRSGLEMILLRMLCFRPEEPSGAPADSGEATVASTPQMAGSAVAERGQETNLGTTPASRISEEAQGNGIPATLSDADWSEIVGRLDLKGIARQLALNCVLQERSANTLRLLLDSAHAHTRTANGEERLRMALEQFFGEPVRLNITLGQSSEATPARQQSQQQQAHQQAAEETIDRDANVRALREAFGARVKPGSVLPTD
jgi:DNA polymerase-3 subunit gamma/tau